MPRPTKGPRVRAAALSTSVTVANLAINAVIVHDDQDHEARVSSPASHVEKLITKGKRVRPARPPHRAEEGDGIGTPGLPPFRGARLQFEGREGRLHPHHQDDPRKGDNAPMAVISLVLEPVAREIVSTRSPLPRRPPKKAVADEDKAEEKKATTEKVEKADKAEKG